MKIASISKLKAKLSEHLATIRRGEEVVVTERGKPVARIVPVGPESLPDERLRDLVPGDVFRAGRMPQSELEANPSSWPRKPTALLANLRSRISFGTRRAFVTHLLPESGAQLRLWVTKQRGSTWRLRWAYTVSGG